MDKSSETNGNVVTSDRFSRSEVRQPYTREELEELQKQTVVTSDYSCIDSLELQEPQRGEQIIGTMTEEECAIFVSFYEAKSIADKVNRKLSGTVLRGMGAAIEEENEEEFFTGGGLNDSLDKELAVTFFREQRRADYLKNRLYWMLGERFGVHDYSVGIRSKRRVVKGQRKW